MSESETVSNLGIPLGPDLGAIERELTAFWQSASQVQDETAVLRACSCNLIVIARNRAEAAVMPPVLAELCERHPCRSLVTFHEAGKPEDPPLQGWVLVQCNPTPGGPQVCCEVITLEVRTNADHDLPNALLSLLVPDLPVFLYWRSPKTADWQLVQSLIRFSDLLVVDSQAAHSALSDRVSLQHVLMTAPPEVETRDLAWSRLTAWRDLIAQFFDTPADRSALPDLEAVEIGCLSAAGASVPFLALLLTGWMSSRLGWHPGSIAKSSRGWTAHFDRAGECIPVHFLPASGRRISEEIQEVVLRASGGRIFSVRLDCENSCLTARRDSGGEKPVIHSVLRPSSSEAELLLGEFFLPGEDTGFGAALAAALALERLFP